MSAVDHFRVKILGVQEQVVISRIERRLCDDLAAAVVSTEDKKRITRK